MKQFRLEAVVGLFVIVGLGCLAYLSVQLARVQLFGSNTYTLTAVFPTVSGLRSGASVEIAGVTVGHVQNVKLDGFDAVVVMRVRKDVRLSKGRHCFHSHPGVDRREISARQSGRRRANDSGRGPRTGGRAAARLRGDDCPAYPGENLR